MKYCGSLVDIVGDLCRESESLGWTKDLDKVLLDTIKQDKKQILPAEINCQAIQQTNTWHRSDGLLKAVYVFDNIAYVVDKVVVTPVTFVVEHVIVKPAVECGIG